MSATMHNVTDGWADDTVKQYDRLKI